MDFNELFRPKPSPQSTNPNDYDRHILITDSKCLMIMTEITMKTEQVKELETKISEILNAQVLPIQEEGNVLRNEAEALRTRLFMFLKRLYPDIVSKEFPNHGYRKNGDDVYFVSWADKKESE